MIEFPEVQALSAQLTQYAAGRKVLRVLPPAKTHKFCWFQGDPALLTPRCAAQPSPVQKIRRLCRTKI